MIIDIELERIWRLWPLWHFERWRQHDYRSAGWQLRIELPFATMSIVRNLPMVDKGPQS